jgi:hypothetical protein
MENFNLAGGGMFLGAHSLLSVLGYGPKGFPQGAPISPILSILALEPSLFKLTCKVMMYADDGLKWGRGVKDLVENGLEALETTEPIASSRIKYAPEKSG